MPGYWLFLTDPADYSLERLFTRDREVWDGVFGTAAQKFLGQVRRGDRIIGYHTAPDKQARAVLEAVSDAYQNPELQQKNWVVDLRGVQLFPRPVPLPELADVAVGLPRRPGDPVAVAHRQCEFDRPRQADAVPDRNENRTAARTRSHYSPYGLPLIHQRRPAPRG